MDGRAAQQTEPQGMANATHDIQRHSGAYINRRRCTFEQTTHTSADAYTYAVQKSHWQKVRQTQLAVEAWEKKHMAIVEMTTHMETHLCIFGHISNL